MKKIPVIIYLVVLVLVMWLLTLWGVMNFIKGWPERGQFGDLFGSVNALFSGLAFASLIYTIYLQKQELSLQREELKLQREEMAASRKELAAQVKAQQAILRVNISQIKVIAEQVHIEALKIKAETESGSHRNPYINSIDSTADMIRKIADDLEKDVLNKAKYIVQD